jgi:hypothetical protein
MLWLGTSIAATIVLLASLASDSRHAALTNSFETTVSPFQTQGQLIAHGWNDVLTACLHVNRLGLPWSHLFRLGIDNTILATSDVIMLW